MEESRYTKVNLNVGLDQVEDYSNLFQVRYRMYLHQEFLETKESKKHNMSSHTQWLRDQISLNHNTEEIVEINKRKIVYVNFGMNIGTEINGIRPAVVYKQDQYKFGEDTIVIPITSYQIGETKSIDTFDIIIDQDASNGLDHTSLLKIRQMKCVSKKRLRKDKGSGKIKICGIISDYSVREKINFQVKNMFGI